MHKMNATFTRYSKALVPILVLLLAFSSAAVPASATQKQASRDVAGPAQQESESPKIYLAQFTLDPLQQLPQLPAGLAFTAEEAATSGVYILQFQGPVLPEWKKAVMEAGAQLGDYLPDYAFLARIDDQAKAKIQALPFVRWVGVYQPGYKFMSSAVTGEARSYRVMFAPWADMTAAEAALKGVSTSVRAFGAGFAAVLDDAQVSRVAHMADVVWIEPYYLQRLYNDVGGGTIMSATRAWSNGYNGSGMTIAVADTGLDTGITTTIHQDFAGRVTHLSSWPVQYANYGSGCETSNVGANDGAADTESGHGTHVAGSVAGSGARSSGQYKGLAYAANITFQAVEQYTTWTSPNATCPNGRYLTGIPDDVRDLLAEVYGWGARVQNDSWGGGTYGVYDQQASYFDDFVFQHKDMAVVVAAGNDGRDTTLDGYVDGGTVSSPGTSKNVIVIGASENERASGGYNPGGACSTYYTCWGSYFPTNPTRNDPLSNSREHMAAFSSRGPMNDGRIKPDLVAPGTNILSVRSSQASEQGWGAFNQYYMYMGGTSMASPLSAGAATLVREFYVESQNVISPSAALIKATLINTAVDISGYGNSSYEAGQPIPNSHEGWGRIDVGAATTPGTRQFVDEATGVTTGITKTYIFSVSSPIKPLKISLVWSDYAGAANVLPALVNDLNLRVTAPNNTVYLGNVFSGGWSQTGGSPDTRNNVENVYVQSPAAGQWKIEVIGQNVPQGPQPFALVIDGDTQTFLNAKAYLPIVQKPAAAAAPTFPNGTFESGASGWTQFSTHGATIIMNSGFPGTVTPHGGSWAAWLGGLYSDISYVQRQVAVPAGFPYLAYWHWIASADACGINYDIGGVLINSTAVDTYTLCTPSNTNGWVKHVVNLSSYAGQTVTLQIRAKTDSTLNSNLFVDDVAWQSSSSSLAASVPMAADDAAVEPKEKQDVPQQDSSKTVPD
ncbi:MAG: S8 family serine peptidase [Chloroflexi bacterium]|nr:S8 family serine peptidase [Chloroflexota bacterium]